ncbi:hypothetical protein BC962_2018 [Gillisia mitskevichiae]|uniref:Uncharacterized protein n=1 Tax=Gillisia mitskevichiae TaxID=270921 RepID=A0A495PT27_9FLAO|nr:hypothetical protein [Gillisia mitskevichiae]RKS53764.1 hypothetical protein BC962_2018 [Gillisia mitskevichiae]
MKIFKIYLKYLIVVSFIYMISMIILDLVTSREMTINNLVIRILIFGFGITIMLVTFHINQVKSIAKKYGVENPDYDVSQKRDFYSNLNPESIFNSVDKNNNYSKVVYDKKDETINIKTEFTGKSWGDKLTITSQKNKDGYNYEIISKPIFPLTIIDFGQNLENISKLENYLKNLA